jgi:hypothetical protein
MLDKVAGVVAGNFNCQKAKDAKEIERVLRDYFAALKMPVLINCPVGHIPGNATLPHGALVEMDGDGAVLRLLENPVEPCGARASEVGTMLNWAVWHKVVKKPPSPIRGRWKAS